MLRDCPYCSTRVFVKADGICPSCRRTMDSQTVIEPPAAIELGTRPEQETGLAFAPASVDTPSWTPTPPDVPPSEFNPFAAPAAPRPNSSGASQAVSSVSVRGKEIEGRTPLILPDRCFCCNDDTGEEGRILKKLVWAPSWIYVMLIPCGIPGLLVAYLCTRKTLCLEYSLCQACASNRRMRIVISILAWLSTGAMLGLTIYLQIEALYLLVLPMLLGSLIATILANWPVKIGGWREPGTFRIKGAGYKFLRSLSADSW